MTNYSHIKLSDHFYPQQTNKYPGIYFPCNETTGALLDPLNGLTADRTTTETYPGAEVTNMRGYFPAGTCRFTMSNTSMDTNTFVLEALIGMKNLVPTTVMTIADNPRHFFWMEYVDTFGSRKGVVFKLSSSLGAASMLTSTPQSVPSSTVHSFFYVVVVCLGIGADQLKMYVNRELVATGTYVPKTSTPRTVIDIGGAYSNATTTYSRLGVYSVVSQIGMWSDLSSIGTSFSDWESLMALRQPDPVTAPSVITSYPIKM
jgi:hypothetical protein